MPTMVQLVTRVPDEIADAIDTLVADGQFESRSEVVRAAIADLVDRLRRDAIGREIIASYERIPETDEELADAYAASLAVIREEPW